MIKFITIDEKNRVVALKSNVDLKEEIKMSLVNMAMNIGYFNIKISIKKDEEMRREKMRKKAEHIQRINKELEKRNNLISYYNMYNFMR